MITYLVVDKLPAKPGVYGVFSSKEQLDKIISLKTSDFTIFAPYIGLSYLGLRLGLKAYGFFNSDSKIIKIRDIVPIDNRIGTPDSIDIILQNIILLNNKLINENYDIYDNIIFDGVFKKKSHLESILPINKQSELVIITKKDARNVFRESEFIKNGLNVSDEGNKKLFPLSDFISGKWNEITTSISHIYSFLGASKIEIKDKTENSNDIKTQFEKAGVKVANFNLKSLLKRKFELKETFDETLYYPDQVKDMLFMLNEVPHLKQKASDLVHRRRSGTFNFQEEIDATFGISIGIVATFNGIIEGGYRRELEVKIEFS